MTLNYIWQWGSHPEFFANLEYPFIAISRWSTLHRNELPVAISSMSQTKLFNHLQGLKPYNCTQEKNIYTWKNLTVCKQEIARLETILLCANKLALVRLKGLTTNYSFTNYIYIHIYVGAFNKFPDFFVQAFINAVDSWKVTMLLIYILWDDWPIFMISASNEQLGQQLEYILLKPDCHSCWISKIQSGRENTLEERYAIKFCFKLGKNTTETYGMLQTDFGSFCMNLA